MSAPRSLSGCLSLRSLFLVVFLIFGAVPVCAVTSMSVKVATSNIGMAGTDNDVILRLVVSGPAGTGLREWNLDNPADNFEKGAVDDFSVSGSLPLRPCDIQAIGIRKTGDDSNGGWHLAWFQVFIDGQLFFTDHANRWIEDEHLEHWSSFQAMMCPPPPTPPSIDLGDAPLPSCTVAQGTPEFPKPPQPDKDCDDVPDAADNAFDPADTDEDGIPDAAEDWNRDGVVDPGETDPKDEDSDQDGKPDGEDLADADGDCLADIFEDLNRDGIVDKATETDKTNADTDGDGWLDGSCNVRTRLLLLRLECFNSQEDTELGDDEAFLTANHTRWPEDKEDLAGIWELSGGTSNGDLQELARRTRASIASGADLFKARLSLREEDLFDFTDDDLLLDRDHVFGQTGLSSFEHLDEGFFNTVHYKVNLVAVSDWFADPNPREGGDAVDGDQDGLSERRENEMAALLGGVADPFKPDIYMELDSVGEDQVPERFTKEDIASRFTYNGFAFHLDDGVFGGGQVLPYVEDVYFRDKNPTLESFRTQNLAKERCGAFHYVLAVDQVNDEVMTFGKAKRPRKAPNKALLCGDSGDAMLFKSDFWDNVSDLESIVWLHEFGHNLGLCHREGDPEQVAVGPGGPGGCSSCPGAGGQPCNCTHYALGQDSDSAMGSGNNPFEAIDREVEFDPKEWAVVDLATIANSSCP